MPVDAHSQQGAPNLLATRYGGPITIRAKEGMPKANLKARPTQQLPCTMGISHTGKILDSQCWDKIGVLLGIYWVLIVNSQNWESATKPILRSKKSH